MFCPKCGHDNGPDDLRYCVRCGLGLAPAAELVRPAHKTRGLSRRARGILQGIAIFPTALGAWLLLDILYESVFSAGMLGGLYAMVTLIALVSIARVVYAIVYEGSASKTEADRPELPSNRELLPESIHRSAAATTDRDLVPSVVDSTTRKLHTRR